MHSAKITAIIVTLNEEKDIPYALKSVRWCDDILVIDLHSEDRTVEYARQYTQNILYHDRVPAVELARQYALDRTDGEWILIIDPDEVVPPLLAQQLRKISIQDDVDVVYLPFKNHIWGKWVRYCEWWPDMHARFFRKGAVKLIPEIHSKFQIKPNSRILMLPGSEEYAMMHFSYLDIEHFVEKTNRYTSVEAIQHPEIKYSKISLLRSVIKEFRKRYIKLGGYRDGELGFFLSIMYSMYQALTIMKRCEITMGLTRNAVASEYDKIRNAIIG